jgi:hypothetical protein
LIFVQVGIEYGLHVVSNTGVGNSRFTFVRMEKDT